MTAKFEPERISKHTIKKIELVSSYVTEWARKILGYEKSQGLIYIDCMSNCGEYYDDNGNLIDGTPVGIAKMLDSINIDFNKDVFLVFNDFDKNKIDALKNKITEMHLQHINVQFFNMDANTLLKEISKTKLSNYNTLVFYDPYKADIDWSALEPFFNIWGEVIINHMISDPIRAARCAKKEETKARYEKTYQQNIADIIKATYDANNKRILEQRIEDIISLHAGNKTRDYYIASFPFYIKTNQLLFNLIFF